MEGGHVVGPLPLLLLLLQVLQLLLPSPPLPPLPLRPARAHSYPPYPPIPPTFLAPAHARSYHPPCALSYPPVLVHGTLCAHSVVRVPARLCSSLLVCAHPRSFVLPPLVRACPCLSPLPLVLACSCSSLLIHPRLSVLVPAPTRSCSFVLVPAVLSPPCLD